jgi:hypothetical protein
LLRRDWRRRQEQCSDQREFLHVRPRFGGLITDPASMDHKVKRYATSAAAKPTCPTTAA